MKQKYIKAACIIMLACIVMVTLIAASNDPTIIEVKHLLIKRTDIMENVLSGNISVDEGKVQLKDIEKGKLYNDDVKRLIDNMNCEHNKVIAMNITELKKTSNISDIMTYETSISWKCSGINGIYVQNCSYIIAADTSDDEIKLVSFEIAE